MNKELLPKLYERMGIAISNGANAQTEIVKLIGKNLDKFSIEERETMRLYLNDVLQSFREFEDIYFTIPQIDAV